jgi:hypothetical protein
MIILFYVFFFGLVYILLVCWVSLVLCVALLF